MSHVATEKEGQERRQQSVKSKQQMQDKARTAATLKSSAENIFCQPGTPADSQVQLLSIDAFKYTTQSPPLTMVTKTLLNN